MNKTDLQRGFTLVEIAIVLVIIGLLLGGILKGQELIRSARVRNLADQNSGIQGAYYGFVDRYRQVPGDMQPGTNPNAACSVLGNNLLPNCQSVGGDGDGSLDVGQFPESAAVWAHMQAAGFIQGNYSGQAASEGAYTSLVAPVAPQNPWGGFMLLGRSNSYSNAGGGAAPVRLHLILGNQVPVEIMRELDLKIDDSFPFTGVLRASPTGGSAYGTVGSEGPPGSPQCTVASGGNQIWDIAGASVACNGYFLY